MNRSTCLIVLLLSETFILVSTSSLAKEAELGKKAPFFFVSTYNPERCGMKRVFLDRLVGPKVKHPKKVLLLSFFNIDCKPCRKEMPFLQKLYERYKEDGLGILVINCDYQKEKIEELHLFLSEFNFTFPVLKDRFQALQRRYGVESFPTMFVLDGQGVIQDIRVGYNEKKKPFPLAEIQKKLGVLVKPLEE